MANIISVPVYQRGSSTTYPSGITQGIVVKDIRGEILPIVHQPTGNPLTGVGAMGEVARAEIAEKVYSVINVILPSNAGTVGVFTSMTVAQVIAAANA